MWRYFHGEAFVTTGGKAQNRQQATSDSDTTTMSTAVEARPIRQPSGLIRLLGTFGAMKRQIFGPCYDPYQRDEVVQEEQEQRGGATNQQELKEAHVERPTKGRRSLTSIVVNTISNMACGLFWDTTTAQPPTSSAWENRMQEAERLIRGICSQNQQQQRDSINNPSGWGLPLNAAVAYQFAVEEDNSKWGLVNKEDLKVCFLALMPPPKPKRTYIAIQEVPTPLGLPVGVPHNYQHSRTHHHLFHDAVVLP
ncbi:hypothetical protein BDB00DRAFT_874156 [Zychaea mexicana]|uniref:uncharacterized protein n=1 Tax=Zychaea mexicana TaxID=64656 RepID=UPI0022FE8271|nr:uncharacterized protein BDB00DRAFT_874156 [Zychaea mexicana]KAI9491593.1 hypothetical protein BDB00DRAFT_874156 [Zychaea mexicana]